ncbi:hypothetical protein JL722_14402 [Aureococcus anophagefferens]|nr:hypothetical protein JL722_14402 [Aureococcus anophagefferens]
MAQDAGHICLCSTEGHAVEPPPGGQMDYAGLACVSDPADPGGRRGSFGELAETVVCSSASSVLELDGARAAVDIAETQIDDVTQIGSGWPKQVDFEFMPGADDDDEEEKEIYEARASSTSRPRTRVACFCVAREWGSSQHPPQVCLQAAAAPGKAQRRPAFRATLTQSSFLFFLLMCDHAASSAHAPSEGHDAQARTHAVKARGPVAPFLRHRFVGFLSTQSQVFVGASFRCQDSESRPLFVEQSGPSP